MKPSAIIISRHLHSLSRRCNPPLMVRNIFTNRDADEWWMNFGIDDLELQNLAIRILSQTCSSSGSERNWSVFERIHTKRRNRLEHKRLNDLVYTHYNLRLKERQSSRKSLADPISLENIDLNDEWVVEAEAEDAPLLDEVEDWMDIADAGLDEGEGADVAGNDTDKIRSNSSFETSDDFERRIFSGLGGDNPSTDSFYQKLDRLEKARAGSKMNDGNDFGFGNGMADGFNPLSDGMDGKLKKAATSNVYNDEIHEDDYAFRPDVSFKQGMTYTPKDLDLTKTGVQKYVDRESEFDGITTDAVLKKADFRNVRFLAKFLTEAGIIIKRKQTGISAKAQRKVAREIKTARAFGLMPFTTMGRKPFCFGKTMEDLDEDYEMDYYDTRPGRVDPIKE